MMERTQRERYGTTEERLARMRKAIDRNLVQLHEIGEAAGYDPALHGRLADFVVAEIERLRAAAVAKESQP